MQAVTLRKPDFERRALAKNRTQSYTATPPRASRTGHRNPCHACAAGVNFLALRRPVCIAQRKMHRVEKTISTVARLLGALNLIGLPIGPLTPRIVPAKSAALSRSTA